MVVHFSVIDSRGMQIDCRGVYYFSFVLGGTKLYIGWNKVVYWVEQSCISGGTKLKAK